MFLSDAQMSQHIMKSSFQFLMIKTRRKESLEPRNSVNVAVESAQFRKIPFQVRQFSDSKIEESLKHTQKLRNLPI